MVCLEVSSTPVFGGKIATNVSDALSSMLKIQPDMVFSDINLGSGVPDGIEFIRHLRASGNTVPCYVVSGYSKADIWPKAEAAGANGYLQLPFEPDEIKHILEI